MKTLSAVTIIAMAIFAFFPGLDLQVSHLFYNDTERFFLRGNLLSVVIDQSVRICCIGSALLCLFVFVHDSVHAYYPKFIEKFLHRIRQYIKFTRRQLLFVFLVIALTPGILVHWVMKPVWERARPVNVTVFQGQYEYSDFYHLFAGQDGRSFPSGHASMAFSLVAIAFLVSEKRRRKVLVAIIAYASLASFCRVWQGSHWLSDITFSAILTIWTILLVKKFYLEKGHNHPTDHPKDK